MITGYLNPGTCGAFGVFPQLPRNLPTTWELTLTTHIRLASTEETRGNDNAAAMPSAIMSLRALSFNWNASCSLMKPSPLQPTTRVNPKVDLGC